MVCVLPFRASCDALEALITNNKNRFKNLGEYTVQVKLMANAVAEIRMSVVADA